MLNNIFNIRYNSSNNWKGQIEPMNGFCSFESVDFGIRAAFIIIRNYIKKGFNTLPKIIERYAPLNENPTYHYYSFVINGLKKKFPTFSFSTPISSNDRELIVELLYYMMLFENHKQSRDISRSFIQTTLNNFHWS